MMSRYLVRCIQEIVLVLVNLTLPPVPKAKAAVVRPMPQARRR
ncbi:MAG: hypothetical protein WBK08_16800 [Nitrospira sp.]